MRHRSDRPSFGPRYCKTGVITASPVEKRRMMTSISSSAKTSPACDFPYLRRRFANFVIVKLLHGFAQTWKVKQ
jgi:hypothetical protein